MLRRTAHWIHPCRTLAAAYPVTQSGGDIIALDPADYGPVTITGAVSILGVEGAVIAVAAGTTGITIHAPAGAKITIRDISISGAGAANTTGIALTGGLLVLRNSTLKLLTTGLSVTNTHADVINTDIVGNTIGIETNGPGVPWNSGISLYLPTACPCETLVRINGGNYVDNTTVFLENNPTASGGQPSATFWAYNYYATGYTTLETSTGTGSTSGQPSPQDNSPPPN